MKKFLKGMHKDSNRVDQPESTYRDALNATLYYRKGSIVNEQGTISVSVQDNPIVNIVGECALEDGRFVIFALEEPVDNLPAASIIAIVDPQPNQYTVLYRDFDLNFQPTHTIEATSKVNSENEILVYFTDNYIVRITNPETGIEYIDDFNPPRVFNITKQERSLAEGNPPTTLYSTESFTANKLDLFLHAGQIPEFTNVEIEEGGGVISGTYHLAVAYVDEDKNTTNYLSTSNPVYIVSSHEDAMYTGLDVDK
jgi:hypothetical protein